VRDGGLSAAGPARAADGDRRDGRKPYEFGFTLSKYSNLRAGPFVFGLTNGGVINTTSESAPFGFRAPARDALCRKATKVLRPARGRNADDHAREGKVRDLSSVTDTPRKWDERRNRVGVRFSPGPPDACLCVRDPPAVCVSPKTTAVSVVEFEYGFTVSQSTVPCGTVTVCG